MNHNFIRLNSNNNIETKKIFFVVLRKIHGEIDWILPLVNSFNKNYLFIGIIENIKEISVLQKNSFLNEQFKKNFHGYFIENKYKNIFYRFLFKFLDAFNLPFCSRISEIFKSKYFSPENLISIISKNYRVNNLEKMNILLSYDKLYNGWEEQFSKKKNSTTYYFPSSCSLKPNENILKNKSEVKINNKFLIISNDLDTIHWKNVYPNLEQIVIGYPRYGNAWMEKIKQIKINPDVTKIYLSYRKDLPGDKWFNQAVLQFKHVINILKNINKNFEIYVKIHPYTDQNELNNYLINEKNIKFISTNLHQQEICKISDFSINFFRSASILESLSTKTPAIELAKISDETFGSPYKEYDISFYAENNHILEKYIKKFSANDKEINFEFNAKYKNFENICLKKNSIDKFEEFLNLKKNTIENRSKNNYI